MDKIVKRDGAIVSFDANKIETAILKAAKVTKEFGEKEAVNVTKKVVLMAQEIANKKESETLLQGLTLIWLTITFHNLIGRSMKIQICLIQYKV